MTHWQNMLLSLLNRSSLWILGVLFVVSVLFLFTVDKQYSEHQKRLVSNAESSYLALSANLESELSKQRSLLEVLVNTHQQAFLQILQQAKQESSGHYDDKPAISNPLLQPMKAPQWIEFQKQLLKYFPELQQFALLDDKGAIVMDGEGFFMGNACRKQVETGLKNELSEPQPLQAHFFHDGEHHYDLVIFLRSEKKPQGAVIVSVPMTYLAPFLNRFLADDLQLLMLKASNPNQIILSSYDDLDFQVGAQVSSEMLEQAIFKADLQGTQWRVYFYSKFDDVYSIYQNPFFYLLLLVFVLALGTLLSFKVRLTKSGKGVVQSKDENYEASAVALLVVKGQSPYPVTYLETNGFAFASTLKKLVVLNQPIGYVLHAKDHSKWLQSIEEIKKNPQAVPEVFVRLQHFGPASKTQWVMLRVAAQRNDAKEIEKYRVYLREANSAEVNHLAQQDWIESIPYPVVLTDSKSVILASNQFAKALLDDASDGLIGLPFDSKMSLAQAQVYRSQLSIYANFVESRAEQMTQGEAAPLACETFTIELKNAQGKSEKFGLSLSPAPALYENGFVHFLAKPTVVERVNTQSSEIETAYYEALLARFNIGHHISDELSELMGFLRGVSDRLKFTFIDKVSKIHADEIRSRSDAVMRSLHDFKFLALKNGDLSQSSFDAYILIEESIYLLRLKARWHGIHFHFSYEPTCPYIWMGYENRTKQIVLQMLSYMIERANCSDVLVSVSCIKETTQPPMSFLVITLTARDANDKLRVASKNLAEDFAVIHGSHDGDWRHLQQNLNLQGLDVTSHLLQSLQGELDVLGEAGSTDLVGVKIKIPVYEDAEFVAENQSLSQSFIEDQPLAGMRYLIVEKDPVNQQLLKDLLGRFGAQADTVDSGIDAIGFWRNYGHLYAGLLIERESDVMSAEEVINFIRREERDSLLERHFPILLLQGRNDKELINFEILSGFDGVIEKPLITDQVLKQLLSFLPKDA